MCFSGYRFRQKCFSGSRRSDQHHSFWNFTTKGGIFIWEFQKVNYFLYLFFSSFHSGDISKGDFYVTFLIKEFSFRLSYIEYLSTGSATSCSTHSSHDKNPYQQKQSKWN